MAKSVITIPATVNRHTAAPIGSYRKRRVAAYARVSTDHEEQQSSYEAQVDYYTNYINGREDWEFVSVYADEGITGCNTKKRDGFNKMVEDALSGAIDLIITKSVSRFARNTVDSLTTIRKLKENRVECYFEKENIWTFDGKGELLLTIMSSLAQEESRSISENCTWGQRKRFADGKVTVPFKRFLGYDRGEDGNLVINKEPAGALAPRNRKAADGGGHPIARWQGGMVFQHGEEHPHERLSYNRHNPRKAKKHEAFTGYAYFIFIQVIGQGGTDGDKGINRLSWKWKKLCPNSTNYLAGTMDGAVRVFYW